MTHFIRYLAMERAARLSRDEVLGACRKINGAGLFEVQPGPELPGMAAGDFAPVVNGAAVTVMFVDKPLPEDARGDAASFAVAWPVALNDWGVNTKYARKRGAL